MRQVVSWQLLGAPVGSKCPRMRHVTASTAITEEHWAGDKVKRRVALFLSTCTKLRVVRLGLCLGGRK